MGSPWLEKGRISNEDQVEVTLSRGFWCGKYQVTQREWELVIGTKPWLGLNAMKVGSNYPVTYVGWGNAREFGQKQSEQERNLGRLPDGWAYGLPTEAQWEYACRAGTTSATAFGDQLSSKQANFNGFEPYNGAKYGPYLEEMCETGLYPSNAWGLHDMHGNVFEWCLDRYGYNLPGGTDPVRAVPYQYEVSRGGCWHSSGQECRSANRDTHPSRITIGFRVALVPAGQQRNIS